MDAARPPGSQSHLGSCLLPLHHHFYSKTQADRPPQAAFMFCSMCRHLAWLRVPKGCPVTPHWGTGHLHLLTHCSLSSGGSSVCLVLRFQSSLQGLGLCK